MIYTDKGLLITCELDGRINMVHYSKFESGETVTNGKLFVELFNQESIGKVLDFIVEIKKRSASFGWELFLKPEFSLEPYYFGGVLIDDSITILASKNKVDFNKFLSGIAQMNNEQINKIRALEKVQTRPEESKINKSSYLFDEISRLNNELVNTQRELTKKNIELAELNTLKNQFLGMAAHDLRNPLGFIYNFVEFIEEERENLSQEQIEFIGQIKSLSKFLLNLVTDLLDVSSIEAGEINLILEQIDLIYFIDQNVKRNRFLAQKKNITINFTTNCENLMLQIDKNKIEQVMTNLITNAIKFSQANTIINVGLKLDETNVIISVTDQGQGIDKEELNLLFKPFKKTSTKSTAGEKSTGLGLFIVKRIVEAHNGKIWAESELTKGSTFIVSLPIHI